MDPRTGIASASQRPKHGPPNSTDANVRPPEFTVSGLPRPVLNYSIQTGEEFALEFMRERAISKKPTSQNELGGQNVKTNETDVKNVQYVSQMWSESNSDFKVLVAGDNYQLKQIEKKNITETEYKGHCASSRSMQRVASGECGSQTVSHGYNFSEASDHSSKRLKILCSFGGKVLPRPSDGKLRYVGGDTRIIRISRDVSWEELMRKTISIYNRPHTIKYQLPGEELDALISVSSDEDLQNMIEEYSVFEGGEGCQKLRMFLFGSDDIDVVHLSLGSMESDSESQYIVAVNGMDLGFGKSADGNGLAGTSASDLDQLLNLNIQSERGNSYAVTTHSAEFVTAPAASRDTFPHAVQAITSTGYESHSQGVEDHSYHYVEGDHYAYSSVIPLDRFRNLNSRTSIPLSVPSDYPYRSNITEIGSFNHPGQQAFYQGMLQDPHCHIGQFDKEVVKQDRSLAVDNSSQRKLDNEHFVSHMFDPTPTVHHCDVTISRFMHAESNYAASQENLASMLSSTNKGKQLESASISSANCMYAGCSSERDEDDHSSSVAVASGNLDEVGASEVSYSDPPSRPSRVYQSERFPREQAELLSRLSKSDNSIGSQYLINQACLIAAQEPFAETADIMLDEEPGLQTEKSQLSTKPPRPSNATTESGHALKSVFIPLEPEAAKFAQPLCELPNQVIHEQNEVASSVVQAGLDQSDVITDEKSDKQGRKIQKPQFQIAPSVFVYDKPAGLDKRILQENSMSKHVEKANNVAETDTSSNIEEATNNVPSTKSLGADISWVEISSKDAYNTHGVENATSLAQVESTVGTLSKKETSAPSPERKDILIDIDDRCPPNLLPDLFNKATIEDGKDDAGLSVNMQNHERKNWSFFRNLTPDEFNGKDFSLMDQDHISYTSLLPKVEEGISRHYQFPPLDNVGVDFSHMKAQIDFSEDVEESSSTIKEDPNILHPGYLPSQITNSLVIDKDEHLLVENPFTNLQETLKTHISENEVRLFYVE